MEKEKFNLTELEKDWVETFYESDWKPDTINLTETEKQIISELSSFLPRHMPPYDWNLPFADMTILIIRNILAGKKLINK